MNKEAIKDAVEKIREILCANPGGSPNEVARRQIITLCESIERQATGDGYIPEKAGDIKREIDIFYSHRKHLRFKRDFIPGVDVVRGNIQSLLGRIESWHGWEGVPKLPDKPA